MGARSRLRIGDEYECAVCHGIFRATIDDEEARAEKEKIWQPVPGPVEEEVICDICFQEVMRWAREYHPEILMGYGL